MAVFDVFFQGHSGLPGIRGPKGEKVFTFVFRHRYAFVLVFPSAQIIATSPLPSFVLRQGEIGRPGSKVRCSSLPACHIHSPISPHGPSRLSL